jgi:hypothetical protein
MDRVYYDKEKYTSRVKVDKIKDRASFKSPN